MPDIDNGFEAQDEAEAYDETHRTDEMEPGDSGLLDEPDLEDDVYDVTSALGDAEEDEDDLTADDMDDEDLDDLDLDDQEEDDEDMDGNLDNDFEDAPESSAVGQRRVDWTAGRPAPIEPGLIYTDDLDALTNPRDDDVEKYESTRELSTEQLADLGYRDRP